MLTLADLHTATESALPAARFGRYTISDLVVHPVRIGLPVVAVVLPPAVTVKRGKVRRMSYRLTGDGFVDVHTNGKGIDVRTTIVDETLSDGKYRMQVRVSGKLAQQYVQENYGNPRFKGTIIPSSKGTFLVEFTY